MNMVERVARAINTHAIMYSHATGADMGTYCKEWTVYRLHEATSFGVPESAMVSKHSDKGDAHRVCSELNARAAIAAMREPTKRMSESGNSALSANGVDCVEDDDSTSCYIAMIDAALKEDDNG